MAKSTKTPEKTERTTATKNVAPFSLEKKEDNTLLITIRVPWNEVEKVREEVIQASIQQVEIPGFRKGKAPRNLAEAKLSKSAVQEEILKRVLSQKYQEAVQELKINPIINPRIHVEAFDEGTDLVFSAETCEAPEVKLEGYKEAIQKVTAKSKIIVPGKEEKKPNLEEIIDAALSATKVTIPNVLVGYEADRLLSQLLEEIKTLGLSLEQYLSTRNVTSEQLRKEYEERAEKDLKLEFMLRTIADEEKITVEAKDIEEALGTIEDEKQKKELMQNPYLVASVIRQQKTIDFLTKI